MTEEIESQNKADEVSKELIVNPSYLDSLDDLFENLIEP